MKLMQDLGFVKDDKIDDGDTISNVSIDDGTFMFIKYRTQKNDQWYIKTEKNTLKHRKTNPKDKQNKVKCTLLMNKEEFFCLYNYWL